MRPKRGPPPPQVTRSLFFKAPGHQVTFFHEKIKTTQVTGRFFKLSRSRGRPQNGPRSQVAKNPSWASDMSNTSMFYAQVLGLSAAGSHPPPPHRLHEESGGLEQAPSQSLYRLLEVCNPPTEHCLLIRGDIQQQDRGHKSHLYSSSCKA